MANRYDFTITPRDVDFSCRATLVSLCDYILEAAGKDADSFGFGLRDLLKNHTAWVLSRMAVAVGRFPRQDERFTVETWVESVEKLHTVRNFIVRDESGAAIAGACTYWSMIGIADRKPQDLTQYPEYMRIASGRSLDIKPVRVRPVRSEPVALHRVAYTDIDFNGHANTSRYIGWMLDTLPLERFNRMEVERLDINFLRESVFGALVAIVSEQDGDTVTFSLQRDETAVCNAIIRFKTKQK